METQELRIGNLVMSKVNGISKVEQIGSSLNPEYVGGRSLDGNYWENSYLPIPLTKQWLIDFGFEEELEVINGITNYDYYLEIGGSYLNCEWNTKGTLDFVYLEGFDIKLLFVHELQNLYYALTGEELTIKTK